MKDFRETRNWMAEEREVLTDGARCARRRLGEGGSGPIFQIERVCVLPFRRTVCIDLFPYIPIHV